MLLMLCVALIPLTALAIFDYRVTYRHSENEIVLRTDRLVSNTKRTISFFLEERKAALQFIVDFMSFAELDNDQRLSSILNSLSKSIGGFTDLGLFNDRGRQIRYIGPYDLKDVYYGEELWFHEVMEAGSYISEVYMGFREAPHMVIAVKKEMEDGTFFILRATLNTASFNEQLFHVKESGFGDSFLINLKGIIQTPSLFYGDILTVLQSEVLSRLPKYGSVLSLVNDEVLSSLPGINPDNIGENKPLITTDHQGNEIIMGYAYIPGTQFILLVIGKRAELMESWHDSRTTVVVFLAVSGLLILLVIPWVATNLVNDIYRADQERLVAMRETAQSSKLASIGRLAAGVAHEINNPLAIINEKAGLLGDLLAYQSQNEVPQQKLAGLVDSIQRAVERCAGITHRLLDFARPGQSKSQQVNLAAIIGEVLEFFNKEAKLRDITVQVKVDAALPPLTSDRGKLQQIFLNLISNAFAALNDGGRLDISATSPDKDHVQITVRDSGHGISEEDLKRVFEPFFSTKTNKGGTGLGLSITYGLIQELNGRIQVESTKGVGTTFYITLPLQSFAPAGPA